MKLMVEIRIGENGAAGLHEAASFLHGVANDFDLPDASLDAVINVVHTIETVNEQRPVGAWLVADLSPNEAMLDSLVTRWDAKYALDVQCGTIVRHDPDLRCSHGPGEHEPWGACLVSGCGCAEFKAP